VIDPQGEIAKRFRDSPTLGGELRCPAGIVGNDLDMAADGQGTPREWDRLHNGLTLQVPRIAETAVC